MRPARQVALHVDGEGRLTLPADLMARYGLMEGAEVRIEEDAMGLRLSRSTASLARIYVEPTNACNLACRTCVRHAWKEPLGQMSEATFARILQTVEDEPCPPEVFFGGFGEPLSHPRILTMVREAKARGAHVELITNGILLTGPVAAALVDSGLDRLWVSLDGASPESYADVRLGEALPTILANLEHLRALKYQRDAAVPKLGIAFVAMRRNLAELPDVMALGKRLGADTYSVSHVLPHTPQMQAEALYQPVAAEAAVTAWSPRLILPRLELDTHTEPVLREALKLGGSFMLAHQELKLGANRCPFIERGSVSVRWDGMIAPCLSLLHDHDAYLGFRKRTSLAHAMGHVDRDGLRAAWDSDSYTALRKRILAFDFSFCTSCNSCDLADSNQEDCFGNVAPTCGGCLWAQGLIQCP